MEKFEGISLAEMIRFDKVHSPVIIAGPCAVESLEVCLTVAEKMIGICERLGLPYVFKSSYDKANRTSGDSFRSIGFQKALKILSEVKTQFIISIPSNFTRSLIR